MELTTKAEPIFCEYKGRVTGRSSNSLQTNRNLCPFEVCLGYRWHHLCNSIIYFEISFKDSHVLIIGANSMIKDPTIIPIASGKGGVGKSFLAANLAIALAKTGKQTIAVDLDMGGANLHSFLGMTNKFPGIGDFLKARNTKLHELLVPTMTSNLSFLAGDGKMPLMPNIPYAQKIRLISAIKDLPADYILLDLGAGSSYNILDFFRIARHGFVVTLPEHTSIMGMMVFLKNFIYRTIERNVIKNRPVHTLLQELLKQPMQDQDSSIEEVLIKIAEKDHEAANAIRDEISSFRPRIIINQGESPDEFQKVSQISKSIKKRLSLETDFFGFIYYDKTVKRMTKNCETYLPNNLDALAAKDIVKIAQRILKYWQTPIKNSADILLKKSGIIK